MKQYLESAKYYAKRSFCTVFNSSASMMRQMAVGSTFVLLPATMAPTLLLEAKMSDVRVADIGDRQLKSLQDRLVEMRKDAKTKADADEAAYVLSQERVINLKDETLVSREQQAITRATEWMSLVAANNADFEHRVIMSRAISERDASRLVDDYRQINPPGFLYYTPTKFYPTQFNYLDECQDQYLKGSEGSTATLQCLIDKSYEGQKDDLKYLGGAAGTMLTLFLVAGSLGRRFNNQTKGEAVWRREEKRRKAELKKAAAAQSASKNIDIKIEVKRQR